METRKKLLLFTIEVYLGDSDHTTNFSTFAYDREAAEFFVKNYIDHYITDDYKIKRVFTTKIKEGVVLVNDWKICLDIPVKTKDWVIYSVTKIWR